MIEVIVAFIGGAVCGVVVTAIVAYYVMLDSLG
jgi:hypothetical protein